MEIEFRTDIGRKRKVNQDAVGIFKNKENLTLAVVADGMGGHQAGEVASKLAVADLGKLWEISKLTDKEEIIQWLIKTIQRENEIIYQKGQADAEKTGMGTTIVAVVVLKNYLIFAHVGDSRLYMLRGETFEQMTEDHSLVNLLVQSGEITKEMAEVHPQKNVLVRSVGIPGTVEVDVTDLETLPDDCFLVCSDGLTNMINDDYIATIIKKAPTLEMALEQLIETANGMGGKDNITALLINVSEGGE